MASTRSTIRDCATQTEFSALTPTTWSPSSTSDEEEEVRPRTLHGCNPLGLHEGEDDSQDSSVMQRLASSFGSLFSHGGVRECGTQTLCDPLVRETERLAFDVVYVALGRRFRPAQETSLCLWTCVSRMNEKHDILINSMVNRIDVDLRRDDHRARLREGYRQLCDELFKHNEVSWAKIVALFAFSARLAVHLSSRGDSNLACLDVASNLADFAVERLTPFLRSQGGWATLCEVFPVDSDYESHLWQSLVVAGLGLTAMATILALKR